MWNLQLAMYIYVMTVLPVTSYVAYILHTYIDVFVCFYVCMYAHMYIYVNLGSKFIYCINTAFNSHTRSTICKYKCKILCY